MDGGGQNHNRPQFLKHHRLSAIQRYRHISSPREIYVFEEAWVERPLDQLLRNQYPVGAHEDGLARSHVAEEVEAEGFKRDGLGGHAPVSMWRGSGVGPKEEHWDIGTARWIRQGQ